MRKKIVELDKIWEGRKIPLHRKSGNRLNYLEIKVMKHGENEVKTVCLTKQIKGEDRIIAEFSLKAGLRLAMLLISVVRDKKFDKAQS